MGVEQVGKKILHALVGIFNVIYLYLEALYRQFVPPPMKPIDGEIILVTGACGGIGKALCRYIVQSGTDIKLAIWDLNLADLEKLAKELKSIGKLGLKVYPFVVDISSKEKIKAGCKQVKKDVGSVTIIFNNAGTSAVGPFLHLTDEDIEKVFQVNLMSHLWIIREFLPEMVEKNHGRIVNICSMGSLKASVHGLPYFASKYAVNGYTEALKMELGLPYYNHDGVHVSAVYPYLVQTPLLKSLALNPEQPGSLPKAYQRFQTPEEVAKKAVDGMRREYEYIYCPSSIPIVILMDNFYPKKLRTYFEHQHLASLYYKDTKDQEVISTPFAVPKNSYEKSKKGK